MTLEAFEFFQGQNLLLEPFTRGPTDDAGVRLCSLEFVFAWIFREILNTNTFLIEIIEYHDHEGTWTPAYFDFCSKLDQNDFSERSKTHQNVNPDATSVLYIENGSWNHCNGIKFVIGLEIISFRNYFLQYVPGNSLS